MKRALGILLFTAACVHAASIAADSSRGAQSFQTLLCVQCHSINGQGGKTGPDLGHSMDRGFTPSMLAATMWNHAPEMWAAMRDRDVTAGNLDDQAAMDLFAYFYSAHFFDQLGDAGRGKRAFVADHCVDCHGPAGVTTSDAKPVAQWNSIGQPIELVNAMWNHAATMRQEFVRRKLGWPELTSQDLTDMLVYLRNLPTVRDASTRIEITAGSNGQALFESKGCAACHADAHALTSHLKGMTLTDIAVAMWNHAPKMAAAAPSLQVDEMREIVSYLWAQRFFEGSGNAAAGERVFAAKHCATCHADGSSGAPKLVGSGRTFTDASMVSVLWHHGPQMLAQMKAKGIAWPRFEGQDMANLIAYLNTNGRPRK